MRATAAEIVSVRRHGGGKKKSNERPEASVWRKTPPPPWRWAVKPCQFDGKRLFDCITVLLLFLGVYRCS